MEKTILGIALVVFIGLGAVFLSAQMDDATVPTTGKATQDVVVKQISSDEARDIALSVVKGEVRNVELETDEYFPTYEVALQNGDSFIEVEINAQTGDIMHIETEDEEEGEDENVKLEDVQKLGGRVTKEQAKQIALDHIGGGTVRHVSAESEGGLLLYEVEITKGSDVVEVEVNAATGDIVEVEWNDD